MRYTLALLAAAGAAVHASPFPQAVTSVISPSAAAPSGCTASFSGSFGIVNVNVTTASSMARRQATQTTAARGHVTAAMVSMIGDGQIQGGMHTQMMAPVTQIHDGQIQGNTLVMMPVTEISDGQPQATRSVSVVTGASQISDGQPQATSATGTTLATATATAASQTSDAQPQAGSATGSATSSAEVAGETTIAFCQSNDTLSLTLENGVLKDAYGRTGYIASNYQFQFDNPPQAGAIYTAGFTICGNGTLSLGGSSIWYQCRSGGFYNLYDRYWAPQCNAIYIHTGGFVNCTSS